MRTRAAVTAMSAVLIGTLSLTAIAPWLNPCIGASRFTDCVDPNSASEDPDAWCYWGVCDYFPSAAEKTLHIAALLAVLVIVGAIVGLIARQNRVMVGIASAVGTAILSGVSIWYVYPYAGGG